ncbi:MAG: polymer-forming cytoskeletal protein [Treponema sp.]|jgi:cytoskeletal protein CcmA (bactofilin family)|nr:polymer-forming cytoskeletal protein [Treponema sp.]
MAHHAEDFSINTFIGAHAELNGDLETDGFTRLDGVIRGGLTVKGRVIIGESARLQGPLSGTAVTIGGVVQGNVLASERLTVLATAIVLGDVITRRIQAGEGCLIHGRIRVCPTEEAWEQAISEYRDAQGVKSALLQFTRQPSLPSAPMNHL